MKSLIASLILISSLNAFADINGPWIGWVYWNFQGQGDRCDAQMKISEDAKTITRSGGTFECTVARMDIPEAVLVKKGEVLMLDGEEAGTWKENFATWTERYSDTVVIKNTLKVEANHMDYQEEWIRNDGSLLYEIKGRMFRQ